MNRRSNRLNGVQYFLKSSITSIIEHKFDEFQEKFLSLDPFRTGFISAGEFAAILHDICDELEDIDADEIAQAYDTNHDDRLDKVQDYNSVGDQAENCWVWDLRITIEFWGHFVFG